MNKVLFPAISWWLLLLIPVAFFGFYPTYFSKLTETATVFHLYAFFMVLWIAMAIIQPLLIKRKNTRLHRLIGKISYFIMPVVFITAWFVIRYVYNVQIDKFREEGIAAGTPFSDIETRSKAADYIAIGIVYLGWLVVFYTMAVINRKRMLFHATYMFAAILTLLGPTADRLIYFTLTDIGWKYNFMAQKILFSSLFFSC